MTKRNFIIMGTTLLLSIFLSSCGFWQDSASEDKEARVAEDVSDPEELLDIILNADSAPKSSSNPGDYINANQEAFNALVGMDTVSLLYMFTRFETGEETGLAGHIMMAACRKIMFEEDLRIDVKTGQEWYNTLKDHIFRIRMNSGTDFVKENYPKSVLVLEVSDQPLPYAFDMVMFSDSMVEIMGEKMGYDNTGLDDLLEGVSIKQIEQMMYRAVLYYHSAYVKDFDMLRRLSTGDLNDDYYKWGMNQEVDPAIAMMMTLNNYTDKPYPSGIKAPVILEKGYGVTLYVTEFGAVEIKFEIMDELAVVVGVEAFED